MPGRSDLKNICKTRFKEVKILFQNGFFDGAKYLSGYVVETALKARICKILNSDYPETGEISKSYLTHKFDTLVKLGGLQKTLDAELNSNIDFKTNWSLATDWTEAFRYKTIGSNTRSDMQDVISALEDTNNGVLTWIKKRW